jgi:hypothetical protein
VIFDFVKGHESIHTLIKDTAQSLADNVEFAYETPAGFDQIRNQRYPFVVLDPPRAVPGYTVNNVSNYSKIWLIQMAFYAADKAAATGNESAKILDDMDAFVDDFINKLNFYSDQASDIVLTSFSQEPFIKSTANILTGYILTFQMQVPDNFDYCKIEC